MNKFPYGAAMVVQPSESLRTPATIGWITGHVFLGIEGLLYEVWTPEGEVIIDGQGLVYDLAPPNEWIMWP